MKARPLEIPLTRTLHTVQSPKTVQELEPLRRVTPVLTHPRVEGAKNRAQQCQEHPEYRISMLSKYRMAIRSFVLL